MTREPVPITQPTVLTIAGSDSGGGAGIQADIKTIEAHDAFATSAITGVTAQNTQGVERSHVLPVREVRGQLEAVGSDFDLGAIKTGMLATEPIIETVTDFIAEQSCPTVIDPVMVAASGDRLLEGSAEAAYEQLIANASLVTPNTNEGEVLTGRTISDADEATEAGRELVEMGAEAALVKGGHLSGDVVTDVLVTETDISRFVHPRINGDASHGSGCCLSSAIASQLAHGYPLSDSVTTSLSYIERAVRYPLDVGHGPGAVHHLVELRNRADQGEAIANVREIVQSLIAADVRRLVPEVGMNVVKATRFAEHPDETAAVDGRITKTIDGVTAGEGIALGASSHVARFLLAVREHEPTYQWCINCRFNEEIETALSVLDGPIAEFDRSQEPPDSRQQEGSTMQWGATAAFEGVDDPPIAVIDRGAHGKEPIVKLLARDGETLRERVFALNRALE